MKKLNELQVEELYQFTRRHYVEYYDVQTELVDHLANGIEEQWEKDPEVPFEQALQKEFKKFGIFGFSEVVERKGAALEKRYFKLIWQEIKNQIVQLKGFLAFISLYAGVFFLLMFGSKEMNAILTFSYLIVVFIYIIKTSRKLKQKKKQGERIFLMEYFILNVGQYFTFCYIPFQVIFYSDVLETQFFHTQLWLTPVIVGVFTLMIFGSYICLYLFPKKKEEILLRINPEMKYS